MELNEQIDDLHKGGQGLSSDWFSEDKTPEERAATEKVLRNSTVQFRLLRNILATLFKERAVKEKDFASPNWEVKVAFDEGYKTALKEIYRRLP